MIAIEFAVPAFIVGVVFLYKGSDILVEGTAKTAAKLGISALIISLIIVAFGTSAPEFAISVGAAFQSHEEISFGNIVGSCIANLLLVLGIGAIIQPIRVKKSIIKREMPILLAITALLLLLTIFGLLDLHHQIGGIIFLILFGTYLAYFLKLAKGERNINEKYDAGKTRKNIIFIILGISGVVIGAKLLIESTVAIATFMSISEMIIAASVVAIGTSLPELVVSVMAAYKKESDIAVGNVIGSNVFNILMVLGACAIIVPFNAMDSVVHTFFLLLITIIMFPVLYTGHVISRKEGALLLSLYGIYIWYIFFV